MANPWESEIASVEEQLGIPKGLLRAIASVENAGGNVNAVSTAAFEGSRGGAQGVMQVMPETFAGLKRLGKLPQDASIRDPRSNILAGGLVLKEGLDATGGDITKSIAYYNTSPQRALSGNLLPETKAYVPKVLDSYKRLGGIDMPAPTQQSSFNPDQSAMDSSVSELIGSMMERKVTGIQTGQQLMDSMKAMRAQSEVAATAEEAKGIAAASGELLKGQKAGELQKQMATIMEGLGMSPDQSDNYRGQMLASIEADATERSAVRKSIIERQSVGIFDNPISWFLNQLALPGEIGRHNAILQDQMAKENELKFRNEQANTDLNRSITIAAQQTTEEATQAALQKLETAKSEAAKLKMQTEGHAATTAIQFQNLASQQVQDDAHLYGIYKDKKAEARAEEDMVLRKQHMDLMMQQGEIALEANKDKRDERQAAQANLENANAFYGRSFTKDDLAKMRPEIKQLWALAVPMDGVIGRNFPEALDAMLTFANVPVMAKTNKTQAEFLESLRKMKDQELFNLTKEEQLNTPKEEDRKSLAIRKMAAKFEVGARNVDAAVYPSGTNPYKAAYDALTVRLELQANAVVPVINAWKTAANGSTRDLKDSIILSSFGKETLPEDVQVVAQHISQFYKSAANLNEKSYAFEIMHLPKQEAYMINYKGKPLDLTNPAAVANVLLREISNSRIGASDLYFAH